MKPAAIAALVSNTAPASHPPASATYSAEEVPDEPVHPLKNALTTLFASAAPAIVGLPTNAADVVRMVSDLAHHQT